MLSGIRYYGSCSDRLEVKLLFSSILKKQFVLCEAISITYMVLATLGSTSKLRSPKMELGQSHIVSDFQYIFSLILIYETKSRSQNVAAIS